MIFHGKSKEENQQKTKLFKFDFYGVFIYEYKPNKRPYPEKARYGLLCV